MKFLRKVFFGLVYALPAVLFFSFYPLISFGSDATMNFELSLPLIWLVLFDMVAFISLLTLGRGEHTGITDRRFFLFALFPLFATFSIFWSSNLTRSILTVGVLWLTFFAVFALLYILPLMRPVAAFRSLVFKSIFISTALVCGFCWLQCILDLMGIAREGTLLCAGCTYRTFGFPHPSGFAIEPQFMGNLLLAPTLLAIYLVAFEVSLSTKSRFRLLGLAFLFSATLFVTMSRGAIYAYAVALAILLGFALWQRYRKSKPLRLWWQIITLPVSTFIFALLMQGVFAAVSPTADTFVSGVTKVIHQMSLGIIDLRPATIKNSTETDSGHAETKEDGEKDGATSPSQTTAEQTGDHSSDATHTADDSQAEGSESAAFDGYVAASTNVRLGISDVALRTWVYDPNSTWKVFIAPLFCDTEPCTVSYSLSPLRMLFGVGLGGAGIAMHEAFPDDPLIAPNAIVQNEFISLLLEVGLVGDALILLALWLAFGPKLLPKKSPKATRSFWHRLSFKTDFWTHPALPLLVALIVAYLVTLNFFSGLPNALQIYLMPPLLYLILRS